MDGKYIDKDGKRINRIKMIISIIKNVTTPLITSRILTALPTDAATLYRFVTIECVSNLSSFI